MSSSAQLQRGGANMDGEAKLGPNQEGFEFSPNGLKQWRKQDISKVGPHVWNPVFLVSFE